MAGQNNGLGTIKFIGTLCFAFMVYTYWKTAKKYATYTYKSQEMGLKNTETLAGITSTDLSNDLNDSRFNDPSTVAFMRHPNPAVARIIDWKNSKEKTVNPDTKLDKRLLVVKRDDSNFFIISQNSNSYSAVSVDGTSIDPIELDLWNTLTKECVGENATIGMHNGNNAEDLTKKVLNFAHSKAVAAGRTVKSNAPKYAEEVVEQSINSSLIGTTAFAAGAALINFSKVVAPYLNPYFMFQALGGKQGVSNALEKTKDGSIIDALKRKRRLLL